MLLTGEVSVAGAMMAITAIIAIVRLVTEQRANTPPDEAAIDDVVQRIHNLKRANAAETIDPGQVAPRKFARRGWNHHRAAICVEADYLGPTPLFNDRQFERVFRVTKAVVADLLTVAAESSDFFREGADATGKPSISLEVKVLMGLKLFAYGVSPSAFQDYFQMGESTARLCLKELAKVVSHSETLKEKYFRPMNRSDARRAVALHEENHGISGMIGSIDCMHVPWQNCPLAWHGQYKGKEGKPTIVLEAFADYNLWFWHVAFGFAGTLNDINIWDQSPLKKGFLDGSFQENVDFEFEIGGTVFRHLFLLADGIYPELARFVKTIDEAIGKKRKGFASWQEAARKDIERAFGVLQRKFHILVKPVELWHVNEIQDVVESCIILHNIMVSKRVARSETESINWYEVQATEQRAGMADVDPDDEYVQRQIAESDLRSRQDQAYYDGPAVNVEAVAEENRRKQRHYDICHDVTHRRWEVLHDKHEHYKLRDAIITELSR